MRAIHASPDAPVVDVFVNGEAVLTNVSFPAFSNYLQVPADTHTVAVAPAGQGVGAAVINADVTVEAGRAYSIAAVGLLADNSLRAQIFNDKLAAPAAGRAHVRVLYLSPNAPAVDVKVQGGPTLISGLAFPNASQYLPVDAGTYDLVVTPAGGDDVVINLSSTQLQAGTIYDVAAVGQLANIQAEVATFTPAPAMMPDTGIATSMSFVLIGMAVIVFTGGLMLRHRSA